MIKFNIDLSPLTHLVKINLFKIYIYICKSTYIQTKNMLNSTLVFKTTKKVKKRYKKTILLFGPLSFHHFED